MLGAIYFQVLTIVCSFYMISRIDCEMVLSACLFTST